MTKVIGVRFRTAGKIYFFAPGKFDIKQGDNVIVETARGVEFGRVVSGPKDVNDEDVVQPLKSVIRPATDQDRKTVEKNKQKEKEAFQICLEKIRRHKDQGRYRNLRAPPVLQHLSDGVFRSVHQDGKGAESVPESYKDIRGLRQADVLPDQ